MLVSIVMAVYRPNMNFFIKQLNSLNHQTYKNIEILIRDDSDDEEYNKLIKKCVLENIDNFEYRVFTNDKNLGSNKTFEKLTNDSNGEYIAYCDQDDIWEINKIEQLVKRIQKEKSEMVYSDLSIINEEDEIVAKSFKNIRKRLKHIYGENKFAYFIRKNSVTGCTMLIKREIALMSIPFNEFYVHDHWLTINASIKGKISYIEEPLVKYRIHSANQIGASKMIDVNSSEEYLRKRLYLERKRCEYLLNKCKLNKTQIEQLDKIKKWVDVRINMFENKNIKNILLNSKYISNDYQLVLFEIGFALLPQNLMYKIINILRKTNL